MPNTAPKKTYYAKIKIDEKTIYPNNASAKGEVKFESIGYDTKRKMGRKLLKWLVEKGYIPPIHGIISDWRQKDERVNFQINEFIQSLAKNK